LLLIFVTADWHTTLDHLPGEGLGWFTDRQKLTLNEIFKILALMVAPGQYVRPRMRRYSPDLPSRRRFAAFAARPIVKKFDQRSKSAAFRPCGRIRTASRWRCSMTAPACALGRTSSFGSKAPWFEITDGSAPPLPSTAACLDPDQGQAAGYC